MKRLLDETADDFERALLRSAKADRAPTGGAEKAAIALASAAAVATTAATAAGLATAAASIAPRSLPAKAGALSLSLWKWLGAGALIGGVAGAGVVEGVHVVRDARTAAEQRGRVTAPAVAPIAATVIDSPQAPPLPSDSRPRESVNVAPPKLGQPPHKVSERPAPTMVPAESASALAAEVEAIDRARLRLNSGSPDEAIGILDRYERESPTHTLAPEAAVLRIEAEKARGHDALATALAEKFLAAHPTDPHVDRVRRLLARPSRP